jgi:GT2 family glycosyltransferase
VSETSVIVPIYQNPSVLRIFLDSLLTTVEDGTEVILINDGSGSAAASMLKDYSSRLTTEKAAQVTLIEHDHPLGCGQSLNDGLRIASGRTVVLADSDLILRDGWQQVMRQTLSDHPRAGMTGSVLVYPQTGGVQHAGIRFTTHVGRHWRLNALPTDLGTDPFTVQIAAFALFGMTREVLDGVGLMDEHYLNGYEDFDFQMRARQLGFETVINPAHWNYHWERSNGPHRASNRKSNLGRFWSQWSDKVNDDLTGHVAGLLADQCRRSGDSVVVDVTESRLDAKLVHAHVDELLESGTHTVVDRSHVIEDGAPVPFALAVPDSVARQEHPLVLFVENFVRALDNQMWIDERLALGQPDVVIDLYGNRVELKELATSAWPGVRVR